MNTTITIQNRIWLPLVAAGTALALGVGLLTYVLLQQRTEAGEAPVGPTVAAPTDIPQAEWRVVTGSRGGNKVSKAERARVKKQAAEVTATIQTVYDTLYLDPTNIEQVIADSFADAAGAAIVKPGVGLPKGADQIQTTQRRARIVLYSETGSQAIADVGVSLKGVVEDRPFRIKHAATLWLQRGDKGWKVVAFEIEQKP
jgi:hypothetical protein